MLYLSLSAGADTILFEPLPLSRCCAALGFASLLPPPRKGDACGRDVQICVGVDSVCVSDGAWKLVEIEAELLGTAGRRRNMRWTSASLGHDGSMCLPSGSCQTWLHLWFD